MTELIAFVNLYSVRLLGVATIAALSVEEWERDSLGGELATLIRVTDQADGSPTITRSGVGYYKTF